MLYYLFTIFRAMGHFPLPHVGLHLFPCPPGSHSFVGYLCWFGEEVHQISQKQADNCKLGAMPASTDLVSKKIGVPSMGGVIIIMAILDTGTAVGTFAQHLSDTDAHHHRMAGFLGRYGRLHQDTFKRDKEGLKGKYKIVGQLGIGLIVGLVLWASP